MAVPLMAEVFTPVEEMEEMAAVEQVQIKHGKAPDARDCNSQVSGAFYIYSTIGLYLMRKNRSKRINESTYA